MKKFLGTVMLALCMALFSGCLRSRVIVTSEPPGADVTINNTYRGRTPVTVPFGWYWYYDFNLEKEGYQSLEARERFHTPIWCWMPLDLVAEATPLLLYDTKHRHYVLKPLESP